MCFVWRKMVNALVSIAAKILSHAFKVVMGELLVIPCRDFYFNMIPGAR